jgi:hypothetical protein
MAVEMLGLALEEETRIAEIPSLVASKLVTRTLVCMSLHCD